MTASALAGLGCTRSTTLARIHAGRWQRFGRAFVLHNATLTLVERRAVALANAGPRSALTSFLALEVHGLTGWERNTTHVLVPGGTHMPYRPFPVNVHFTNDWRIETITRTGRLHTVVPAALLAASSFRPVRSACGLLAAVVQQRLARPAELAAGLAARPRLRHHAALTLALADVAQGAEALSEIDFARLCRAAGLPEPVRQAVRPDRFGRRRFLDAEWTRADGRRVVVEVDGALHLETRQWWSDQERQNELVVDGAIMLRFPSVVIRADARTVLDQLRRALTVPM